MAPPTVVLFVPFALSAIVAMLLQLNGFLLLWKIQQARLNVSEVSEVVGTNLVELICGGETSGPE